MVSRLPKFKQTEIQPLRNLFRLKETLSEEQIEKAAGSAFLGILGRLATPDELKRYTGFLSENLKSLGREKAVEQLLIAILFHPEMFYRIELPAPGSQRTILPPRQLARSLAYALTDQKPDEQLWKAAQEGKLSRREDVRQQVQRMLTDDSLSKPRVLRFFQEYFGYTTASDVFKDETTRKEAGIPGRGDWFPMFFVNDTDRLVLHILQKDKHVLRELLTTPKTFTLNGDFKEAENLKKTPDLPLRRSATNILAIYEIPLTRKEWSPDKPFSMPKEHRMGILTHPSWLIAHSTSFRQSCHSQRTMDSGTAARWTGPGHSCHCGCPVAGRTRQVIAGTNASDPEGILLAVSSTDGPTRSAFRTVRPLRSLSHYRIETTSRHYRSNSTQRRIQAGWSGEITL